MPYPLISLESIPPLEPYLSTRRAGDDDYAAQLTSTWNAGARGGSVLLVVGSVGRDAISAYRLAPAASSAREPLRMLRSP